MALTIRATEQMLQTGAASPLFSIPLLSYLGCSKRRAPNYGEQWVLSFESPASNNPSTPSPAEVGYSLVPAGFTAEVSAVGSTHRLTVTTPDDPSGGTTSVISTTFELLGNALQKDIRESRYALALGYAALKRIDAVLNGNAAETTLTGWAAGTSNEVKLYKYLRQRNGSAAFQVSQYVLRWSRVASSASVVPIVYANVEKIYTTAQMLGETGPPIGILASVNEAAETSAPDSVSADHAFGWLKQTPTVTQTVGSKMQITSEWWLAEWVIDPAVYATI